MPLCGNTVSVMPVVFPRTRKICTYGVRPTQHHTWAKWYSHRQEKAGIQVQRTFQGHRRNCKDTEVLSGVHFTRGQMDKLGETVRQYDLIRFLDYALNVLV